MRKNLENCCKLILIVSLIAGLAGCETIVRKFTRKKKDKPVRPVFYKDMGEEAPRPPDELYSMHYTYWKAWMSDLISNAGLNKKHDSRAVSGVIGNLLDMRKHLSDEKAAELDRYITQVKKLTDGILKGSINKARIEKLKQDLDRVRQRIRRNFYYKKIKEYIRRPE